MTNVHVAFVTAALLLATSCSAAVDIRADQGAATPAATATSAPTPIPTEAPTAAPTATPEPTPTPTPLPPGMIAVTDTDAVGVVGDDLISLVEAVQLANGRLTLGELSEAEAALVDGAPGATNTDTISVALPDDAAILLPGGNVWIVELFNNGGDLIDGSGVTITGGIQQSGVSHNAMLIGSSDIMITGFEFERVTNALSLESAGRQLEGVAITGNTFRNTAVSDISLLNSISGGSISEVRISGNTFDAPERLSDLRTFVAVRGGEGLGDEPTENTFIENLSIADNTMSAPGATVATCISIAGGHVAVGQPGRVSGAIVTGVELTGNTISGCTTAIEIAGGLIDQTNGTVTDSAVSQVTIAGSTLNVGSTAIQIHGGRVAPAPPSFRLEAPTAATTSDNRVERVAIETTVVSAFDAGVRLTGGAFDVAGAGAADTNLVNEVTGTTLTFESLGAVCVATADVGANAANNTMSANCDDLAG